MASAVASPKLVDESLWWDSFVGLFGELDKIPPSNDPPDHLVENLKRHRAWFLNSIAYFKPPDQTSRLALDSPELAVGSHRLLVKPELKKDALRVSEYMCLNEVQSYILVHRHPRISDSTVDGDDKEFLHSILFQYFLERQCLLQCVRRIFFNALYTSNGFLLPQAFKEICLRLVQDGFDQKLVSIFKDLFLSVLCDSTEIDYKILWVDESLIEGNLLMDILFLAYYDNSSSCNIEQWKTICSLFKDVLCGPLNIGKIAVSVEAKESFDVLKAKILLIVIETLNLESVLCMVHDEISLREGGSIFSVTEIKELDAQVSSFADSYAVEAGPLLLAWAVFQCLVLSLPERNNSTTLMEIDHISFVRQAFEVGTFDYLLGILHIFKDSDGPTSGFLCVVRTLMSAFVASYELSLEKEDETLIKILDILSLIYHGQESLAMQFWDKDSFIDGPIRSILYMLEKEYPIRISEFVLLLSALCEGSWPAECVFNYLDKMSGITTLIEFPSGYVGKNIFDIVETHHPIVIPGVEGLMIPSGTCGHILKVVTPNIGLIRWECAHSGILLLLLRMLQDIHSVNTDDILHTLTLLYKMVSFNKGVAFALMSTDKFLPARPSRINMQLDIDMRVDVVKIICTLILKSIQDIRNAQMLSISLDILSEMLKCAPSHVIEAVVRLNIFHIHTSDTSSGAWMLSGGLARMLMEESEENDYTDALAVSVLDFTVQLVEKGVEDNLVSSLVVFSLQYIFVDHMQWKYKSKYSHWKVTLKVFELMKSCIKASEVSQKLHCIFWDILICDSSIHNILYRILGISIEYLRLYISYHYEPKEIECVQHSLCSALEVLCSIMANISQELPSKASAFVQTMLSPMIKPMPVVQAAISSISFVENSAIQAAAARVLSFLCYLAFRSESYTVENASLVSEAVQIKKLHLTVSSILENEVKMKEDLVISIIDLLNAMAYYQPALLVSLMLSKDKMDVSSDAVYYSANQIAVIPALEKSNGENPSPIASITKYIEDSDTLFDRAPHLLLSILNFLKALWKGGTQFASILDKIRHSKKFWKQLESFISVAHGDNGQPFKDNNSEAELSPLRYQCQGNVLEIMAHELFFQEKLSQCEVPFKQTSSVVNGAPRHSNVVFVQEILTSWFDSPLLESLIKFYSSTGYAKLDISRAKVAVCVCIVQLIIRVSSGDFGSLSISLVNKIHDIYNKLKAHPAFSALLTQYAFRGHSEDPTNLVVSDLYYHLLGKLEGREITSGPFQELLNFLLSLGVFECNDGTYKKNFDLPTKVVSMFDIQKVEEEIGSDLWEYSEWKSCKEVSQRMFVYMHSANLSSNITDSNHFCLKALLSVLFVYKGNVKSTKPLFNHRDISKKAVESSIQYLCNCLHEATDLLALEPNLPLRFLRMFTTQQELLLFLSVILFKHGPQKINNIHFLPSCILVIKSSSSIIKVLANTRPLSPVLRRAVKLLMTLLLKSLEFSNHIELSEDNSDVEVKLLGDASLIQIELLPFLCKYAEDAEYSNLSVASIDIIIRTLTPKTWFPIIKNHLPLQHIFYNIREINALANVPVFLSFLLTLGQTKGGAEMLSASKFFSPIMVLLSRLHEDSSLSNNLDKNVVSTIDDHKYLQSWVLSLSIFITVIESLGDNNHYVEDVLVTAQRFFFSEKPYMLSFYFSAMYHLADEHVKKTQLHTLTALKLTQHALLLLCLLARYHASWISDMKLMDSELRTTIIHLLAFISKGDQHIKDSPNRFLTVLWQPSTEEEIELHRMPSIIKSKHGWFMLSASSFHAKSTSFDNTISSLVVRDKETNSVGCNSQSSFSDTIAIHIYEIALLLLKFLCLQAKAAAKRADEVDFVDLACFPELPSPEILHGIQDQAIAIVSEVCGANKQIPMEPEKESLCLMLLQMLEKSLYLEFSLSQFCGIKPVLGRVEDFSKEIEGLMQAVEHHTQFKNATWSVKQIIAILYPRMLQTSN
ncbi:uncharacterized protein LOC122016720 isoform X2 [Zingiber officinale]|uniref:uncharacterized protein LOC122016720 isoform X2 n=1 Tax=Zingiber officinale TaxID=94328 RepID=UPI001C4BA95A|nr:uncharacterized protein LOC122016720 isoform X2 [Zingiber officinale]